MSSAARSTPASAGGPQRRRGVEREVGAGGVDVEPEADDDALGRPLAQDAGELPVVVGGHEHVVRPLERGRDPGDLGHGPLHGETGEQRHPRRPARRGRHEDAHGQGRAGRRGPRTPEATATGILLLGDDDAPRPRTLAHLVVRRPEAVEHLGGQPRLAGCDGSLVERSGSGVLAHEGKARLRACPRATPTPSAAPTSRRTSTPRRRRGSSQTSSAAWPRWPTPVPSAPSRSSTPGGRGRPASGSRCCSTRGPSSRWTSTPGTGPSRSARTATGPTATASSPATAPSTGARSRCSRRTSPSSAGRSARCSARRSPRSWTSR